MACRTERVRTLRATATTGNYDAKRTASRNSREGERGQSRSSASILTRSVSEAIYSPEALVSVLRILDSGPERAQQISPGHRPGDFHHASVTHPSAPAIFQARLRRHPSIRDGFPQSGRVYHNRLQLSRLSWAAPPSGRTCGGHGDGGCSQLDGFGIRFAIIEPSTALPPEEQAHVFVHLLPRLIPHGALRGGVAVVVDVLRATTVMVHALAAGCEAVIPCGEIDEAREIAADLPGRPPGRRTPGIADPRVRPRKLPRRLYRRHLPGKNARHDHHQRHPRDPRQSRSRTRLHSQLRESRERPPPNSRSSSSRKTINTPFTSSAPEPTATSASKTACWPVRLAAQIVNLPADPSSNCFGNDEALMVVCQWNDVERQLERRTLSSLLSLGRGGRNLGGIGLAVDFDASSRVDHLPLVAMLERDPLRVVAV